MPRGVYERGTDRAEEVRRERRKQPGQTVVSGIKLSMDESKLDRNRYHYRWAKADTDRIRQLQALDYDVAPENAKEGSLGTTTTAVGGVTETGPYNMILMRKEKDWFETDQKEKMKPLDDMDNAIRRGLTNHAGNKGVDDTFYTPDSGNKIEARR